MAAAVPLAIGVAALAACNSGTTTSSSSASAPRVTVGPPAVDVSGTTGALDPTPVPDAGQASPPGGVPTTTQGPQAPPLSYP